MINQISVFLENRAGQLADITDTLAANGIDIRALNIAETSDYGVMRIITNDSEKTMEILNGAGFIASETKAAAVAVPDRPGALAEVLRLLSDASMDVEYMYSIFSQLEGRAFMVIKVRDAEAAEKLLSEKGIYIAKQEDLDVR